MGTEDGVDGWNVVDGRGGVSGIDGDRGGTSGRDMYGNSRDEGGRLEPATTACSENQHTHRGLDFKVQNNYNMFSTYGKSPICTQFKTQKYKYKYATESNPI